MDNGYIKIRTSLNHARPIAQDHYATPTEKIVEHALDATANAPDEWPVELKDVQPVSDRVREIETKISCGEMSACQVFTQMNQLIPRQDKPQEWDGTGNPPVGTVVRFRNNYYDKGTYEEVVEAILKVLGSLPELSPNLVGFHAENDRQSAAAIYDWLKSTGSLTAKGMYD